MTTLSALDVKGAALDILGHRADYDPVDFRWYTIRVYQGVVTGSYDLSRPHGGARTTNLQGHKGGTGARRHDLPENEGPDVSATPLAHKTLGQRISLRGAPSAAELPAAAG